LTTHSSTPSSLTPWEDAESAEGEHSIVAGTLTGVGVLAWLQGPELLVVLVIVLLLFGSTQLPKLARSLGQAQKEFKQGVSEGSKDTEETAQERKDG
jgi:sec-independent protein translocase protein TatA